MKPNKKDIQKWINALRSGKYKQGRNALQTGSGYCCLGVACDVFITNNLISRQDGVIKGGMPECQPHSPEWLKEVEDHFRDVTGEYLTSMNDEEGFSFDEIADVLQAVYIEEVLS